MKKQAFGWDNFKKAFAKLVEFTSTAIVTDRDRAGVIQAFEFTFEQCWKAFQKQAQLEGLAAASPRQALQTALQLGWIDRDDEASWLKMLEDRNLTSHLYREDVSSAVAGRVLSSYLGLFGKALKNAPKN